MLAQIRRRFYSSSAVTAALKDKYGLVADDVCNVPQGILDKVGRNLHNKQHHPLNMIKKRVVASLQASCAKRGHEPFELVDSLSPFVTVKQNFDDLLIPPTHVSRSPSDTYYINKGAVLRTHTSAHQSQLIGAGKRSFLVASDVYRRDEIDSSHYPVFHQMEGVRLFNVDSPFIRAAMKDRPNEPVVNMAKVDEGSIELVSVRDQPALHPNVSAVVEDDMKKTVVDMVEDIFGKDIQMRWVDGFFPFTRPSLELEIYFQERWMEVMGCGVVQQKILTSNGAKDYIGWAFGFGLERLALKLFNIPDVRLFWSEDERFVSQFKEGKKEITFEPFSKFPNCYKDITFWLPPTGFHDNDFFELVRGVAGDLVENVQLLDDFVNPKTKRQSKCFRINYRSMDRSLTNEEINDLQAVVRDRVAMDLKCELR